LVHINNKELLVSKTVIRTDVSNKTTYHQQW